MRKLRTRRGQGYVHYRCDDMAHQLSLIVMLTRGEVDNWPCFGHGPCVVVEDKREMALFRVAGMAETRRLRMKLVPWEVELMRDQPLKTQPTLWEDTDG